MLIRKLNHSEIKGTMVETITDNNQKFRTVTIARNLINFEVTNERY
ncbi:hypothetical protein TUM4261_24540 [Shewanella sp. c952]|nr:hypothetical protein TUM4261_24540 [Shewanella sp. c952]